MRTSLVLLLFCVAQSAAAQPGGRSDAPRDYIALVYDDMTIPDADRAALVAFVASAIPVERWQTVNVTAPTRIDCLVDMFYDYFQNGEFRAPLTVEALRTAIIRYNEPLGQQVEVPPMSLQVPPFPMHSYHRGRPQARRRLFDAETRAYRIQESAVAVLPDAGRAVDGAHGTVACAAVTNPPADRRDLITDIIATTILVPALPAEVQRLSQLLSTPRHVVIFNTTLSRADVLDRRGTGADPLDFMIGFTPVELLAQPGACTDGQGWLDSSPYFKYWAERKMGAVLDVAAIARRATDRPLHVLDVGFSGGHGEEVLTVARQLLKQLGLEAVVGNPTDPAVHTLKAWELVPSSQTSVDQALALVDRYLKENRAQAQTLKVFVPSAQTWLKTMPAVGARFDVPDVVLSAILWRAFRDDLWLNVSSRMRATTLAGIVRPVVSDSAGVLFAAVGNDTQKLTTGFLPQDHSFTSANVVSVTCGRKAGEICGEYSHPILGSTSPRVLIAGPGCGFNGTSGTGSSLATPYVAVASWLASLVHEDEPTTAPNREILSQFRRHDLMTANMPNPSLSHRVESHGLFDPAYLLLRPSPHVVTTAGHLEFISDYRITPQCVAKTVHGTAPPDTQVVPTTETVLVYQKDGQPHYWERETLSDGITTNGCQLEGLTVDITFRDGRKKLYNLQTFQEEIKWLTWSPYKWTEAQP